MTGGAEAEAPGGSRPGAETEAPGSGADGSRPEAGAGGTRAHAPAGAARKAAVAPAGARPGPGAPAAPRSLRARNAGAFAAVAAAWLVADLATKAYFDAFSVGEVVAGPFLGLFRFKLVHNTGMAWGMFSDSTLFLGAMSLVVCAVLCVYLFAFSPRAPLVQVLGAALVVAGGVGNAIDRFAQGYVVDFIDLAFMDFPVFNVADIGVTCGFVLFLAGMLLEWRRAEAAAPEGGGGGAAGSGGTGEAAARGGDPGDDAPAAAGGAADGNGPAGGAPAGGGACDGRRGR